MIRLYINTNTNKDKCSGNNVTNCTQILDWKAEGIEQSKLRSSEREIRQLDGTPEDQIYIAIYDTSYEVKFNAALGIAQTFMVCVVLSVGAGIFNKLSTDLVIHPIENMIEKVNNIARDPLAAANEEEERLLLEEYDEANPELQLGDEDPLKKSMVGLG